jgi:hypothetical protein
MPPRSAPPTWRLVELFPASNRPCPACGQIHHYLMKMTAVGDCMPVLYPPGVATPRIHGTEVELHVVGPTDRPAGSTERSPYDQVAERVRQTSIRCEGCGERFEDLGAYRVHECAVVYR